MIITDHVSDAVRFPGRVTVAAPHGGVARIDHDLLARVRAVRHWLDLGSSAEPFGAPRRVRVGPVWDAKAGRWLPENVPA